ncbi:MAG: amidohydrolase family protein [Halioglobus sp.]
MNRSSFLTIAGATIALGTFMTSVAIAETILIDNATIHTMEKRGVLKNADILIQDGVVTSIGDNLSAPDAQRIDAAGRHVTPSLFAGITSIGLAEVSGVKESVDSSISDIDMPQMRPEFRVDPAFNPNSSLVPIARVEGLGFTVLGATAKGSIFGGQGRMARLDGSYDSLFGGEILFISVGRNVSELSGGSRAGQWMLLEQAVAEARTPPRASEPALLTRSGRETLKRFSRGGTVVFSVDRASDILQVLRFAKENGFKPVINGGAEAWMVATQLAEAEVPVLLDPLENLPSNFDTLGARLDNAALLHSAGVTVVVAGGESHNARKQRQMAGNAVANGLPHAAGLAALTSAPASVFGVKTGTLKEGQRADLVLWSGDPLETTTVADLVIVNGKPDSMQSRQTLLRDRYLPQQPSLPRAYIKP